ncbi:MAG: MFS transporter [Clostridiales bacterium]|nr:MFS transporter [Clostridiales bacterium]
MEHSWKKTLYLVWFVQILSLMSFSFGLPFLPYYIQDLGVTDPEKVRLFTGILSAAPAIGMGIMAPIWGMVADRFGKKPMLLRAMLSASVILTCLGLVNSITGVLIFRTLQGFLTGTVTAASALIATETPQKNMAYALGFITSATFIGRSFGPAIGGILAEQVGYKPSFYLGGAIMLICFFLVLFFVKETKTTYTKSKEKGSKNILSILTLPIVLILLMTFFRRIGSSVAYPYMPLYVQEIRGTIEGSALITGLISAGASVMSAAAAISLSRLGDKYDKKRLIIIYLTAAISISIMLLFTKSLTGFAIFYALMFFALGGIDPLIMSYSLGLVPENKRGLLFGVRATVGSLAWAASPMFGSYMSINYTLDSVFYLIPVFLILALSIALIIKKRATA